jgi:hypothetical protein
VNLFVVGWSGERAVDGDALERALRGLVEELPFFPVKRVERWLAPSGACAAAWVQHQPQHNGGVRYVHWDRDELSLFAGRPYLWTGEDQADGRSVLEPKWWLGRSLAQLRSVDGRFAALRYDERARALEVITDALGAYAVHTTEYEGVLYFSNNAELLRRLHGDTRVVSLESVAGLLGGGWPLGGDPMWAGVERLPRGLVHRYVPGREPEHEELLPAADVAARLGAGFDAERAAARASAAVWALADWPERPSVVPVTGGRDSRLVLGAALAAGIDFETRTGGEPGHPDVEVGRALAEAAGVPWRLLEHDPHGDVAGDWRRAAELLALTAAGTASLSDAVGFPFGPRPGEPWLWHSGQGGEIARSYYGRGVGNLVDLLYRAYTGRRPGRTELLGKEGRTIVRDQLKAFVDEQIAAGAAHPDVPDLFYLWQRMGAWAGPTHGAVEYVRDTTSPLWSRRLLRDMLGVSARDRMREVFHLRVLEQLAPQLVDIPFEDGRDWPARQTAVGRRVRRAATFSRKVRGELNRRSRRKAGDDPARASGDPVNALLAEIRDLVLDQPDHPAWEVLDRPRVEALLASDAAALDTMSRYYAWRLATVFSVPMS